LGQGAHVVAPRAHQPDQMQPGRAGEHREGVRRGGELRLGGRRDMVTGHASMLPHYSSFAQPTKCPCRGGWADLSCDPRDTVVRKGPPMYNLAVVLEDSARTFPDRPALVLGGASLTYAQVDAAAGRVAHLLVSLGVEPGDRVALSCPNLPQFPIVYYGILKAGAVVVPLNVLNKSREVTYYLDDAEVSVVLAFEGSEEL